MIQTAIDDLNIAPESVACVTCKPGGLTVACGSDGTLTAQVTQRVVFGMTVEGNACSISSVVAQSKAIDVGVSAVSGYADRVDVILAKGLPASHINLGITFHVTGTLNGATYSNDCFFHLSATVKGDKGEKGEDGHDGHDGEKGPTYFPCGSFKSGVEYKRNELGIPLVWVNGRVWNEYARAYGDYWYLKADTNKVGSTYYAPVDNSEYWGIAENFGVTMTGASFANFSKCGEGIMSGSFYYSADGKIGNKEYVDGEGVLPGEVSVDNPPAYTLFLGWPRGKQQASGTLGGAPLYGGNKILELKLAPGQTLEVTCEGQTTSGSGFINIWDADADQSLVTKTFGTAAAKEKISYRNSGSTLMNIEIRVSKSTTNCLFTYSASFPNSVGFIPNTVLDMRSGSIYVLRNADICGTVWAKNLYRNLCLFGEGGIYQSGDETRYFYCATDLLSNYGLEMGKYYAEEDIDQEVLSDNAPGLVLTSYDADIIQMVPVNAWLDSTPVRLPQPEDFPGKVVEISGWTTGTAEKDIYVGCCNGGNVMSDAVSINNGKFAPAQPTNEITLITGRSFRLMSMYFPEYDQTNGGWMWVKLNEN